MDPELPREVAECFARTIAEQEQLTAMGIRVNYVRPFLLDGRRIWALGNTLFYNRRENETFHDFIVDTLRLTLGEGWWEEQSAAPNRHFLRQCFDAYHAFITRSAVGANQLPDGTFSAQPDERTLYLMAVAWDICSLIHARNLPEPLLNRLRHRDQFQGARYEIGIAAVFARLAFDVNFLDESAERGVRHCEFFATERSTGLTVAVEAKSRHRQGVIDQPGTIDPASLRTDVGHLLRQALQQSPGDRPFLVFVDLNMPVTGDRRVIEHGWFADLNRMLRRLPRPTPESPTVATALYFTNFSYHYEGSVGRQNEFSEHFSVLPRHGITDPTLLGSLRNALRYYGSVPNFDVDGVAW